MVRIQFANGLVAFLVSAAAAGQTAKIALNPRASYIDVKARRSELKHTKSKRMRTALADLKACSSLPVVAPPTGPIRIPMHFGNSSLKPVAEDLPVIHP